MSRDDNRLFELLARALQDRPREPSQQRVEAVRARAEAGQRLAAAAPRRRHRVRWALAVGVVLSSVVAFGAGVATAEGLPRPVRAAAHGIGLPVDSPRLVEAWETLRELSLALGTRDAEVITRLDQRLLDLVAGLTAEEKEEIEPIAQEVHLRAVRLVALIERTSGG